jgi:predicted O-methyltransferase YrrM
MTGDRMNPIPPALKRPGIYKVIEAYKKHGYEVIIGHPDSLATQLARDDRVLSISLGVTLSDILVFQWVAEIAPWRKALVIGNAFGFSTLLLASLCPGCSVDAIDAEIEGAENQKGSELTRVLAKQHFPGVQLTKGFSPQDLPGATRFDSYDFIFIDGMHTNEQLLKDYRGIRDLRSDTSVVYCHDVGMARMFQAWKQIRTALLAEGDEAFDLHFTSFGATMVVRGIPELSDLMRVTCKPLESTFYYFGAQGAGFRTAFRMLLRTIRHARQ